MINRLGAAVLALALVAGACGNADGGGVAGGDLPLLPGTSGASASSGQGRTAVAESMAADEDASAPAAESLIAPYQPVEYRLAASAPALGETAAAYRLDADVDEAAVAALASALDVTGTPRNEGDSWVVGAVVKGEVSPEGRQLYIGPDGQWNMFDARADTAVSTTAVSGVCTPDGECTETVVEEPLLPPADLISNDEAEERARELFESAGSDLDGTNVRVQRADRAVLVAFELSVDDVEVMGFAMTAAFGDKGTLQFANGTLAKRAEVGNYPLLDTKAAFDRATARGGDEPAIAFDTGTAVAVPEPGAAEPAEGGGSSGSGGATEPTEIAPERDDAPEPEVEPLPEPVPSLPPKIVELDEVRLVLVPEYGRCPGDAVYLVPAYFYGDDDEGFGPVPAVEDDYLASQQKSGDGAELEPCPGDIRGESVPGREPDAPPVTG